MANQEQLDILKQQRVRVRNHWRREHSEIRPDLSGADLRHAFLVFADLSGADLSGATLVNVTFGSADLRVATFGDAFLVGADLRGADLRGANLNDSLLAWTSFGDVDLSVVKNLETV